MSNKQNNKTASRIVEQGNTFEVLHIKDSKTFREKYQELVNAFCQTLVEQFDRDEKVFLADENELIKLKLNQIKPEFERLEITFSKKTKYGFNKINRYTPDEVALFGYKQFETILTKRLNELNVKTGTKNTQPMNAWLPNEQKRKELFDALKTNEFISINAMLDSFFVTGRVTKWEGNDTALYYLITRLQFPDSENPKQKYQTFIKSKFSIVKILEQHFVNKKGLPFIPNVVYKWKSKGTNPRSALTIDSIIKDLI